jgi:hypothetical protein
MPYQSDEKIFKKRLANAELTLEQFTAILSSQSGKCAYCKISLHPYDAIIENSHEYITLTCYDCSIVQNLNASDVPMFAAIANFIRSLGHNHHEDR